ncbi:MAG: ABC transporter permease subunit [Deltaproteobacteria bacterium]|nr:ABC transporter permease subunit [Deltaproteobacteria bacterium]
MTSYRFRWINRRPAGRGSLLALLPFVAIVVAYALGSHARLARNPEDKLMPAAATMAQSFATLAFERDARSGDYLFWEDSRASLVRMGAGLGIATGVGLVVGVAIGMLPYLRALLASLVAAFSMIPALAILPILFIVFGVGEVAKVVLIVVGVVPFIIRDLSQRVGELPEEQWIKAQTLGASSWQVALRMVLPQILPRLIDALRLSLGPAWLFLISAEAISATSGLGYRIFLVRRYLSMDVILPYVLWITLLAFAFDSGLKWLRRAAFPWAREEARR